MLGGGEGAVEMLRRGARREEGERLETCALPVLACLLPRFALGEVAGKVG